VIVTAILFAPLIGLSRVVQEQVIEIGIPLPAIGVVSVPLSGVPLLAFCSVVLWVAVWLIFSLLEGAGIVTLEKMDLRNRFLYATRPYLSNAVTPWLSKLVLTIVTPIAITQWARPLVEMVAMFYVGQAATQLTERIFSSLGEVVGSYVGQTVLQLILGLLNVLLEFKLDLGIIVLCALAIAASSRFRSEQTSRYAADRHRHRLHRKKQQTDIIVPPIER
jgi:hypothetical protein